MSLHTNAHPAPPSAVVATVPHRRWKTPVVAVGVVTLLAIGAGIGTAALVDNGSGSAHPSTAAAPSSVPLNECGPEMTYLLATVAALPPTVMASLSPELAYAVELSMATTPNGLPAPTTATIGRVLAQLKRADRNAIMAAVPIDQQPAVAAAAAQTADALWASGGIVSCFP